MSRHLFIAGIDRWDDYIRDNLRIEPELTYQIDTARFRIRGTKPNQGDSIIIEDDIRGRLFGGQIVKVDLFERTDMWTVWNIECNDYTEELDKNQVVETYENVTADFIFKDIASKYCPGFTTNGVQSGAPMVEKIIFNYDYPSECFRQLCQYVGWHWQPDYYKDLSFFDVESLNSPAPMSLNPGDQFYNFKHSIDKQGLRNRVYVLGGTMLSDPISVEWKADGVARIWTLPFKPHDITYNNQAGYIGVGGVAKSIGIENVDDEATKDFLLNFEEKYIKACSQTATPDSSATISFAAKQDIDVITTVEDIASQQAIASIENNDGVYEYSIKDDSLVTIEAAEAAGNADLRDHSNPQVKGSFDTEVDGWKPGQILTSNLDDRGAAGTFLIQKVTIQPFDTERWTYHVEYGGRLLGIADVLKALVSAQQKRKFNDTSLLHKFANGQEQVSVSDEIIPTQRSPVFYVGDADAICGFVECAGFFQIVAADGIGIDTGYEGI